MKPLSETSSLALQRMQDTLNGQGIQASTSSHGLISAGGKTTTVAQSRQGGVADQGIVARTIRKLLSKSLWQIKHGESVANETASDIAEVLTPITYVEAATEVGRFLQHYPRRDSLKDGVVIQDLASDFEANKFGIGAVILALRDIRNEYREDNPWVPQTGYILQQIRETQKRYEEHYRRITTAPVPLIAHRPREEKPLPRAWGDMSDDLKTHHLNFAKALTDREIRQAYMRALDIPQDLIDEEVT